VANNAGGNGGWRSINAIASGGAWSSAVLLEPLTVKGRGPTGRPNEYCL
jgi:hypothetical protein